MFTLLFMTGHPEQEISSGMWKGGREQGSFYSDQRKKKRKGVQGY